MLIFSDFSYLVTDVSFLTVSSLVLQEIGLAVGRVSARLARIFQRYLITVKEFGGAGSRVNSKPEKTRTITKWAS